MARLLTLFTGQWVDLPLAELAPLARSMGFDGLELTCGGDHFEVREALASDAYVRDKRKLLEAHGLAVVAIANHAAGQAVCDRLVDARHQALVPEHVWGDGDPEGVRIRAARELADTAQAAARLGARTVTGFSGSPIWHLFYPFPPVGQDTWDAGYAEFGRRFTPVLQAFEAAGVNFALEIHPGQVAFDLATAQRAVDAVGGHRRFGFNFDPSHLAYQGVDYVRLLRHFRERIFHVHMKDVWWGRGDGSVGVFGGHTLPGDPRRYWDFRSLGRGMVDFEAIAAALADIRYLGPLSVEWEDSRMDRQQGARESVAFCRRLDFAPGGG